MAEPVRSLALHYKTLHFFYIVEPVHKEVCHMQQPKRTVNISG